MTELYEELLHIADGMEQLVERGTRSEITEPLRQLLQASEEIGKAWSGSWIGYHANVYYKDLKPRPPGAHFSQEWGLMDAISNCGRGDWIEYDAEQVKTAIRERAGNPDLTPSHLLRKEVTDEFNVQRLNLASILEVEVDNFSDAFTARLGDELKKLSIQNRNEIAKILMPSGQYMTRDTVALGQGVWTPPHISVFSEVLEIQQTLHTAKEFSKLAKQAGLHLSRRQRQRDEVVGKNVFIGYGCSLIWSKLKDFVEDKLKPPVRTILILISVIASLLAILYHMGWLEVLKSVLGIGS